MHQINHLNARRSNSVENEIVGMRHDFTHTRYSLAWLEKVGMLCGMFKITVYAIKQVLSRLLDMLAD
jgi:hypothetical protein